MLLPEVSFIDLQSIALIGHHLPVDRERQVATLGADHHTDRRVPCLTRLQTLGRPYHVIERTLKPTCTLYHADRHSPWGSSYMCECWIGDPGRPFSAHLTALQVS